MNETKVNDVLEGQIDKKKVVLIVLFVILVTYRLTPKIVNNFYFQGLPPVN